MIGNGRLVFFTRRFKRFSRCHYVSDNDDWLLPSSLFMVRIGTYIFFVDGCRCITIILLDTDLAITVGFLSRATVSRFRGEHIIKGDEVNLVF